MGLGVAGLMAREARACHHSTTNVQSPHPVTSQKVQATQVKAFDFGAVVSDVSNADIRDPAEGLPGSRLLLVWGGGSTR